MTTGTRSSSLYVKLHRKIDSLLIFFPFVLLNKISCWKLLTPFAAFKLHWTLKDTRWRNGSTFQPPALDGGCRGRKRRVFAAEPCIIDLGCRRGGRSPPPSRQVSCRRARMVAAGGFSITTIRLGLSKEKAFSVASIRLFHSTARSDLSVVRIIFISHCTLNERCSFRKPLNPHLF